MSSLDLHDVQVVFFDLMGTCVDWKKSIVTALTSCPPVPSHSISPDELATEWRSGFFRFIQKSFERGESSPDIDVAHRMVLDEILEVRKIGLDVWGDDVRNMLTKAWHRQYPWPDSVEGLHRLSKKYSTIVLANGTTKLQLDIVRSSGIFFHTLFSSKLLGHTKPDPRMYLKALEMVECGPSQTIMVAAHAYDLRAASKLGIKTIYIQRSTEDPDENMDQVKEDVDCFVDGGTASGKGLLDVADLLGC